jgi:GTP diphosphokinase / guanosine-3',5'-bis(diphosphate) 3'-diphosphatase
MIRISDIIDKVTAYNPDSDVDIIDRAYVYSARVHAGQVRMSGEPYLSHPLEVAGILADMNLDPVSIAAALLHDVIEDTHTTEDAIGEMFGPEVLHIVAGVTKLSTLPIDSSKSVRDAENIRKMLLAMADDLRVILIKLADRLHNMRTLEFHPDESKRREIARETHDIYAPIAARLGIYWMKKELEDTAFMFTMPEEYEDIRHRVKKDQGERERFVTLVKSLIKENLQEHLRSFDVLGRYKHFYSIYRKMITQNLAFEDVYDIIAFRVIVQNVSKCYEALGLIHSMWKPIDIKFKDYIARPKPNMYRSLHTTVVGPEGERVEIQIRTEEMDRVAKSGIAAHWSYKEGESRTDEDLSRTYAWIQGIVENQQNIKDPDEFLENVRIDLFPDEVYVFTPNGEIRTLPKGATPVDFAYMIHTDVGNQCVGAKVNGRMVPLKYQLNTGDRVGIVTNKSQTPSKDWLSFVKTVKARSRIRQWIKIQDKQRSISLGREMCEKAFRKHRLNFSSLLNSDELMAVAGQFGFKAVDDLIASVGYGKITPLQVVRKLLPKPDESAEDEKESLLTKIIGKVRKKKTKSGVVVKGLDDMLIRFGKCCQPVPGDAVTGYITRGFGVTVHRTNCVNALKMNPERRIDVQWGDEISDTYPVKIRIRSYDRMGLLADVASDISKNGANIVSANTRTRDNKLVDTYFTIDVKGTGHLEQVLASLKKIKKVQEVFRIK